MELSAAAKLSGGGDVAATTHRSQGDSLLLTPPLLRGSMVPTPWGELNPIKRWYAARLRQRHQHVDRGGDVGTLRQAWPATPEVIAQRGQPSQPLQHVGQNSPQHDWQSQGNVRRLVLLILMLGQTTAATYFMRAVLPYQGSGLLEILLLALFAVLFCWVSAGFWTALTGLLVLARGTDQFSIARNLDCTQALPKSGRTAIVMPICNENATRVIAGLRATYESLERTGELAHFDFFILSDSNQADVRAAEMSAWSALREAVGGFGRIYYRHRKRRVKRKSGNIDDFCRRWGKHYHYMIVLDADSVMSGDCLANLVRLMETHPGAGIIQTAPVAAGGDSLYARIQQFSNRVYGPLFTAGLHYWQLGESHYWGHNAIIRVAPFMQHCALAALPGRGSLAGEILSHDFVEAALMRRAGWGVWIAYDLPGTFEEMPSSLLEELNRDRRWCHGNLMNFRLFTARGMHRVHRAVFATGVMAYLSAPLWLAFLALSTGLLAQQTLVEPQYFVAPRQLFPIWPQWHPEKALALFSATATLLFLPKVLAVGLACVQGAQRFGGVVRLLLGMVFEMLFSMLLAPVRMMFHTRFVAAAFLGWSLHWKSPPRGDAQTGLSQALRRHGADMLLGLLWAGGVYYLNPGFLLWLLPIAIGLVLSAPMSILSSGTALGRWCRRRKLFLIPEEAQRPTELQAAADYVDEAAPLANFSTLVLDPQLAQLAGQAGRSGAPAHCALVDTALQIGPSGLTQTQKNSVLDNPHCLAQLHTKLASSPRLSARWQRLLPN